MGIIIKVKLKASYGPILGPKRRISKNNMENYSHNRLWKSLGYLYILLLIYVSVRPIDQSAGPSLLNDKILHGLAYAIGAYWFSLLRARTQIVIVFIFFSGLGMGLEIAQKYLGYRFYDLEDQWANMIGAFIGCLVTLWKPANLIYRIEKILNRR